jgi:hypothetical protein
METVARLVGEHLECDRCAYAEAEADEDHLTTTGSYVRGLPPLVGGEAAAVAGEVPTLVVTPGSAPARVLELTGLGATWTVAGRDPVGGP